MRPSIRSRVTAAAVATVLTGGAATAAVVVSPSAAGASERTCTAWAQLPSRVTIGSSGTVRPRLVGDSGCRADTADGGATAYLLRPGQDAYELRWDRFGTRERVTFVRGFDAPGRYRVTAGTARVYDSRYERVASRWRDTVMTVKYGARFASVSTTHGRVRATVTHDSTDGWRRWARVPVALQRHTASGWHTVARTHASSSGRVLVRHATRGNYRLVSSGAKTVWATTKRV